MSDKQEFLRLMRRMGVEVSGETSSVVTISAHLLGDVRREKYLSVFEFDEDGNLDGYWIEHARRTS